MDTKKIRDSKLELVISGRLPNLQSTINNLKLNPLVYFVLFVVYPPPAVNCTITALVWLLVDKFQEFLLVEDLDSQLPGFIQLRAGAWAVDQVVCS